MTKRVENVQPIFKESPVKETDYFADKLQELHSLVVAINQNSTELSRHLREAEDKLKQVQQKCDEYKMIANVNLLDAKRYRYLRDRSTISKEIDGPLKGRHFVAFPLVRARVTNAINPLHTNIDIAVDDSIRTENP